MVPQSRSEYEAPLDLGTSMTDRGRFHDAIEPLLRAAALGDTAARRRDTATALLRLGMGLSERHGFADARRVHRRASAMAAAPKRCGGSYQGRVQRWLLPFEQE
ncbi:hypothetical protein [Streptomyces fractus]|uniref:hypothetical protein n=1 Tax=Streptomyces fractus TaxID=641806 RepID=UPI003CF4B54D